MLEKVRKLLARDRHASAEPAESDPIFSDLFRGVEGRPLGASHLPHGFFENPDALQSIGFVDRAGYNFLGVIGGSSRPIIRKDGRREIETLGGTPVGILDDRHRTLIAGSRSGKGRSVIVPELLTNAGSIVVIDPKGENAAITARYRARALGQKVCIVDPFGAVPDHCREYVKSFNALIPISVENLSSVEEAGLIADALVVSMNPKDEFWTQSAKAFIEGVILHVATSSDIRNEDRTLLYVERLISGRQHGDGLKGLLSDMADNPKLDNRIAAAAKGLKERGQEELGAVLSTARKNLKFLGYEAMEYSLRKGDFSLDQLKDATPMTVYLVLPTRYMGTCRQLLRLFVNLTLSAVEKSSAVPRHPVQLILDEMATLGHMTELETAIGQIAGHGLRITSVVQDLGQLKAIYGDRYESFLGNSGIIQCFGNVDYFTSHWISQYLGKTAIRTHEVKRTSYEAKQKGESGLNYQTHQVDLMPPEEVRRFFAREDQFNRQLVLIPGRRPWILQRVNYDQHAFFAGRFDKWR